CRLGIRDSGVQIPNPKSLASPRFERHITLRIHRTDVFRPRTNETVVRVLLEYVRRPARDAADREDRRKEIDGDAERGICGGRIEIDVRIELLLRLHQCLDAL